MSSLNSNIDTVARALIGALGTLYAALAGSATQVFSVAPATAAAHAVRKDQTITSRESISITRDMTAATGNVAYTGFSGRPKNLRFYAGHNLTNESSIGESNAVYNVASSVDYAGNHGTIDTGCVAGYDAVGANQIATCVALDAAGFTLFWTKTGAPAGVLTVRVVADL
jgi:hypothetical protein